MSNEAGEIRLNLELDRTGFNRSLNGIQSLANKASKALVAAFTVKKLVDFTKSALDLGSALSEVQNVVDVTFPNMSDKVDKFAKSAAFTSGLSETMAKKYVGTFGSMAEAFGFTEEKALEMGTSLTTLAGDVASFYNMSQDEAYTKLKSVFTGETESLKELGVVMTQTALDQYAMSNGFGKTTAAMTEAEKVALRYSFVQQQLTNASGDFARTSGSWANQVRLLTLQFESFKASVGQGLIVVFTPVIKMLNYLMSKLVAVGNAFKSFMEKLTGKKIVNKSIADTASNMTSVASSSEDASKSLGKAVTNAKKLRRELAGFDKITKLSDTSSTKSTSPTVSSGGMSGGAITSSTPTKEETTRLTKFGKALERLKNAYKRLAEVIGKVANPVIKFLWNKVIKPFAQKVGKKVVGYINLIALGVETVAAAIDAIPKIAGKIKDAFVDTISKLSDLVSSIDFEEIREKIADSIGEIKAKISAEFTDKKEALKEKWDDLTESIKDKVAEMKANVATKVADLKNSWNNIVDVIRDKVADMKANVATKVSDLKSSWQARLDVIRDKTAEMKAKIGTTASYLRSKWNSLLSVVKNKTVTITAKFKDLITAKIKSMWNGIARGINSAITKINVIPGVNIKKLPMLAQGGYVKKNTPQLAMIGDNRHQGEIVAPENKLMEMARMAAQGAGCTSPEMLRLLQEIVNLIKALDLTANISGNDIANMVVRIINNKTKATGRSPIII